VSGNDKDVRNIIFDDKPSSQSERGVGKIRNFGQQVAVPVSQNAFSAKI